jgi:hypothetical protein
MPAQIRRLPHERSTRPNVPVDVVTPDGRVVEVTDSGSTRIDVRTRPDGDLASTVQGGSGSRPVSRDGIGPPGSMVATGWSFTTSVTVSVVPFETPRSGRGPDADGPAPAQAAASNVMPPSIATRRIDQPGLRATRENISGSSPLESGGRTQRSFPSSTRKSTFQSRNGCSTSRSTTNPASMRAVTISPSP